MSAKNQAAVYQFLIPSDIGIAIQASSKDEAAKKVTELLDSLSIKFDNEQLEAICHDYYITCDDSTPEPIAIDGVMTDDLGG